MTSPHEPQIGVRPGDVLAGKYRVERVLGVGGMGVVVAAHHIQLDEKVALKFLLPEVLKNPEAIARFVREARAAVKIKSEHIARVSDVGELDNGSPYMVMEYLEGGDLSTWLKQRGPMLVEQAVDFVLQACEAIAESHALGIVHRDLKPANIFCILRADGQLSVKVLDFGISKVTTPGAQGHDMTSTAAIVGSPNYMSPEQLQSSKGVDTRTDIWSLGVILFELLTARVPFDAETVTELAIKIATSPVPPVRSFRQDVPASLEQVIATCLEKDRERRFASVSELAVGLMDFGSKRARASVERILGTLKRAGISAAELPPSGESRSATAPFVSPMPQTQTTWGHAGAVVRPRGKHPFPWIGTALLLGVFAVGGVLVFRMLSRSRAATSAERSGSVVPSSSSVQPPLTTLVTSPEVAATHLPGAAPSASQAPAPAATVATPIAKPKQQALVASPVQPPSAPAGGAGSTVATAGELQPAPPFYIGAQLHPSPLDDPHSNQSAETPSGPAFLNINAIPTSGCFLDGQFLGATPILNVKVKPGTHTVKFVNADVGRTKTVTISVGPGETKGAVANLNLD